MKSKVLVISALALSICLGVPAKGKKKVTKKKAVVEKVDTVCVDTFSYAMGLAQTNGLKGYIAQRMGVDTAYMDDFKRGLEEAFKAGSDKKFAAYSAGMQIGQQVAGQILSGINRQITDKEGAEYLNEKLFKEAFIEGIAGKSAKYSMEKATSIAEKQMAYYQATNNEKKFGANKKIGADFLAANAKKDSVVTTKSGLQYKILKKGTGALPSDTSVVKVNYEGKLINGTVFDSSYKHGKPASFRCNQVIKGWSEALKIMPVGSVWEVYIPSDLAYGERQTGSITPFSTLIFKVELLEIEK